MSNNWHPQGSFVKHDEDWVIGIESGQGRTPRSGDQATVHKRDGSLQRVTLRDSVGQRALGKFGKVVYLWSFDRGWNDVNEEDN